MRDGDGRVAAAEHRLERLVDEGFAFGVEGGGRFVEDEDVGVFQQCAGDGDALFLPAGELGAAGAGEGFETLGLGGAVSEWADQTGWGLRRYLRNPR